MTTEASIRDHPNAAILLIGDELLAGRTRDQNLPYLARALNGLGIRVCECRILADERDAIVEAVDACRARYDHVFTTGGIGPTHDDVTADSIALAFGVALDFHPEALRLLEVNAASGNELNEARRRMARIPRGATLIDNPVSRAPGFRLENVFVLAGPPDIVQGMFQALTGGPQPQLASGPAVLSRTVAVALPEGAVAEPLGRLQARYPMVAMGSYPSHEGGRYLTSLVCRSRDAERLADAIAELRSLIRELGATPLESEGNSNANNED